MLFTAFLWRLQIFWALFIGETWCLESEEWWQTLNAVRSMMGCLKITGWFLFSMLHAQARVILGNPRLWGPRLFKTPLFSMGIHLSAMKPNHPGLWSACVTPTLSPAASAGPGGQAGWPTDRLDSSGSTVAGDRRGFVTGMIINQTHHSWRKMV